MKKNKILTAVLLMMAFTSCVKTEYHYVDDSLKVWFVDHDKADFLVCDQNGIVQDFRIGEVTSDMLSGSASFLTGDLYENMYQDGRVTYYDGHAFGLNVTNYGAAGVYFALYFYDVSFVLNIGEVDGWSCSNCYDDRLGRSCRCSMEMLDTHEVDGVSYHDVIHFRINDLDAVSRNTFPTELYYAKHYGPVEYELGGKVRCYRTN